MSLLWGLAALGAALGVEALVGSLAPAALGYLDLMLIPVAYYAIGRSQRSAMLAGCAGGLLADAWFQTGVFGMNGLKKTLLGWAAGGLASRLDFNHLGGRLGMGAALSAADQLLELGLYRLLDLATGRPDPVAIAIRAAIGGLLVAGAFPIVGRLPGGKATARQRRRA